MSITTVKTFLDSLPVNTGAIFIAVSSALVAWLLCKIRTRWVRWPSAVVVPFVLSYCLYWSPVWLGNDPYDYEGWAILFIGWWFLAGLVPSVAVVFFLERNWARKHI